MKYTAIADVGGTKTALQVINGGGRVVRSKKSPAQKSNLKKDLLALLKPYPKNDIQLFAGLRGVWTRKEKTRWERELHSLAKVVVVLSDIELAHYLAFGNSPGIVVNAGTGSIAFGRSEKGKTARAGGLGPLLGDPGSAFWIGKEYLAKFKGWKEARAFVVGPGAVPKIAALAERVIRSAAKSRNKDLLEIIDGAAERLVDLVDDVQEELKWKGAVDLALKGGLFNQPFFRRRFERALQEADFKFLLRPFSPSGRFWHGGSAL